MRRDFGMSAREVWDTPEWELDVLVEQWSEDEAE